jgi:hypothetical protein
MLDAAREAVDAAAGLTVADLEADRLRELALERLLDDVQPGSPSPAHPPRA